MEVQVYTNLRRAGISISLFSEGVKQVHFKIKSSNWQNKHQHPIIIILKESKKFYYLTR